VTTTGVAPVPRLASALWFGSIRHRRFSPRRHRLRYPLFMVGADLDELESAFAGSWLWSVRRPAVAWLRRADHQLGDPALPWAQAVREEVGRRLGRALSGPVHLLTNPRTLGFRMNPVSFYWCFAPGGELEALAAEVTNTPWDERHVYVVDARAAGRRGAAFEAELPKRFHVSPFLPVAGSYRWRVMPPASAPSAATATPDAAATPPDRLAVHMESWIDGERRFDATLTLERREITPKSLRDALLRHPALTLRVFSWIYLHAALLMLRRIPFHPHPRHLPAAPAPTGPSGSPAGR
jgi:DUF1365 family protein